MLAIAGMTIVVAAIVALFPETGVARSLTCWLVEAPARWLNRTALWRIAFYAGLIAAGVLMTVLFETEGLLLYGAMAPEILAWAVMFDVGVLIDALLISAAVLASNGVRVLRAQAEALSQRVVTSVVRRSGRARRLRRPSRPAGRTSCDDGPGWSGQPAYCAFSMA